LLFLRFFFQRPGSPRDLHSFPTRRSSDLGGAGVVPARQEGSRGHNPSHRVDRADDRGPPPPSPPRRGPRRSPLIRRLTSADVCRSEEHTSELQSLTNLVCRLLL